MSLTKDLANKIGNLATTGGGDDQGELFKSASNLMGKLEQTENKIIKKKIKKADIINNLAKETPKMDKPIGKLYSMGKSENKEGMSAGNAGGFSGPLIMTKEEMVEKWSQKYKDSIDCNNPKGFSQKAHCQGKSKKGEFKEATSAASSGSYETPAAWAKSTSKKDWRGKSKTQIPGGQFVQVKEKCKKFPYCNQGDINALKLTKPKKRKNNLKENFEFPNVSNSQNFKELFEEFRPQAIKYLENNVKVFNIFKEEFENCRVSKFVISLDTSGKVDIVELKLKANGFQVFDVLLRNPLLSYNREEKNIRLNDYSEISFIVESENDFEIIKNFMIDFFQTFMSTKINLSEVDRCMDVIKIGEPNPEYIELLKKRRDIGHLFSNPIHSEESNEKKIKHRTLENYNDWITDVEDSEKKIKIEQLYELVNEEIITPEIFNKKVKKILEENIEEIIRRTSKKYKISENLIKKMIYTEFNKK